MTLRILTTASSHTVFTDVVYDSVVQHLSIQAYETKDSNQRKINQ